MPVNNGGWVARIASILKQSMSFSAGLLAPAAMVCAVCGKDTGGPAPQVLDAFSSTTVTRLRRSLCGGCLTGIPWLKAIMCPVCGRGKACQDCRDRSYRPFVMNRSAVAYDPRMRDWLAQYKYRGQERLGPVLAEMMLPVCQGLSKELGGETWDAVTYVPISQERAMERGFNQAEQMARRMAAAHKLPLHGMLRRTRHTGKMSFKTRRERLHDAKTLFAVSLEGRRELQSMIAQGRTAHIMLVDDIYTTGSTAAACAEALQEAGQGQLRIYVLTWARS